MIFMLSKSLLYVLGYVLGALVLAMCYVIKYSIKLIVFFTMKAYKLLIFTIALAICVSSFIVRVTRYYYTLYSFGGKDQYNSYLNQLNWLNSFKAARGAL